MQNNFNPDCKEWSVFFATTTRQWLQDAYDNAPKRRLGVAAHTAFQYPKTPVRAGLTQDTDTQYYLPVSLTMSVIGGRHRPKQRSQQHVTNSTTYHESLMMVKGSVRRSVHPHIFLTYGDTLDNISKVSLLASLF